MTAKDKKIIEDSEKQGIPIFVLTAKDAAAYITLKDYKGHCESLKSPASHIEGIQERICEFIEWELDNKSKVKIPD